MEERTLENEVTVDELEENLTGDMEQEQPEEESREADEMMAAIPQPKFSYENGILKKWVEAGCRTKEDVADFAEKHKKSGKAGDKKKKEIGFDLDEFFDAATRRGEAAEKSE